MVQPDKIFKEIEELLQKLIANAEMLLKISSQVFSEQELKKLQAVQEKLLDQLTQLNHDNKKLLSKNDHSDSGKKIAALLVKFESLNNRFVENLAGNHRVIHFKPQTDKPTNTKNT